MLDFYKIFIEKQGIPNDENFLNEYINFVLENEVKESCDEYCEYHHILPRSIFPEYSKNEENIVLLIYENHMKAHELLFNAYNLRVYQRPLNYFYNLNLSDEKTRDRISNADNEWKNKRSKYMSSLSTEEQSRRSKKGWDNISDEKRKEFSEALKNSWDDDRRTEWSKKVSDRYKNEEYCDKIKKSLKKRYENEEYKKRFTDKMNIVNKDENKRKAASESLKIKWQDPEFIERVKEGRKKSKNIQIKKLSNTFKLKWNDSEFREKVLKSRIKYKVMLCSENEIIDTVYNIKDFCKKYNITELIFNRFNNSNTKIVKNRNEKISDDLLGLYIKTEKINNGKNKKNK